MTPSPLLSSQLSKHEEEQFGEISCDISVSSSSCMETITDFDPDAVDFEPLFVSGTGKILNYHSESYYEYEHQGNSSINSSMVTSVITNGINSNAVTSIFRSQDRGCFRRTSSSRSVQTLSILLLAAFMVLGALSWFATDANSYTQQLQTTVAKNLFHPEGNNKLLTQRMLNVDLAVSSPAQAVFWEPHLDQLWLPHCFSRSIFKLHMDDTGLYGLQPINQMQPPELGAHNSSSLQQSSPPRDLPMTVFTSNFRLAAMELFDQFNQGAFITIMTDPMEIYIEQYTNEQEESFRGPKNADNLIVRQLSGIADMNRDVNDNDYDIALQVLRSKFIIGSCDHPGETVRRLGKTIGMHTDSITYGSEECTEDRRSWNQVCRRIKEVGEQNKYNRYNDEILGSIKSKHRYDIMLYEDSKNIFLEQNVLFE